MTTNLQSRQLRKDIAFWAGLLITVLCFYFIFRNIDWQEFITTLSGINNFYLLLAVFTFILSWLIRSIRWQTLLEPLLKISLKDSFVYVMIGYLANLILPMRAGEIVRLVLFSREKKAAIGGTLASLVLEKIFDLVALFVFVVIVSVAAVLQPTWRNSILVLEGIAVTALIVLMIMAFQYGHLQWIERLIPRFVPASVKTKLLGLLAAFVEGLAALKNWQQLLLVMLQSIIVWSLVALSMHFFLLAAHIQLAWHAAIFVVVITNLGTAVISTPGGFGIIHFLTIVALGRYGVDESNAFGLAVLFHESIIITQMIVGFASLWTKGFSWRQLRYQETTADLISSMERV